MGIWRPSGILKIGGKDFPTDAPVVNFTEGPRWNAASQLCQSSNGTHACGPAIGGVQMPYSLKVPRKGAKRYASRPALRSAKWAGGEDAPPEAVRPLIKQFVIHHDGCSSAAMCFDVLQNERGLSCHFLIDNDGTIFQTLDLALMGFHASNWNTNSVGVELCNRGDAKKEPHYYDNGRFGGGRDKIACKINGHTFLAYDYTKPQYDAMIRLSSALTRIFPNLPAEYPQSSPGVQSWDTMPMGASLNFSGFIGHYHLTERKWDPGWFDFKKHCQELRGAFCFFVFPKGPPADKKIIDPPIVPSQTSAVQEATRELYKLNEGKADGGFFPVGPWGESRLWHGGVHLPGENGDPVFAPFPGRVVAARFGASSATDSQNFVLMRHQLALGDRKVDFYSLYMHIADEPALKDVKPAAYLSRDEWKTPVGKAGQILLLDIAVGAGALIAHVATAGPASLSRAQVHVEIFSKTDLFPAGSFAGAPWQVIDGSASGRFCDAPEIIGLIDANKDAMLSGEELATFYSAASAEATRYFVTYHVSEWTAEPSWAEALRLPKDFAGVRADEMEDMVAERITPGLWWTPAVASHTKLPPDGIVYHYHPVSFVGWFNEQVAESVAIAEKAGTNKFDENLAQEVPPGVTDDLNDVDGSSARSSTDNVVDPCNDSLTLKELSAGFDTPDCDVQP